MKFTKCILVLSVLIPAVARAQYQSPQRPENDSTIVLSLDDAIKIALSENTSVKVADMEIQRSKYAQRLSLIHI